MPAQHQKYQVNQYSVASVLNWVRSDEMAVPEIQRPFVWDKTKVRNLLDSLYQGITNMEALRANLGQNCIPESALICQSSTITTFSGRGVS